MRIALLKKGASNIGGSESQARALARALAAMGHDVRVIGLRPPWRRYGLEDSEDFLDGGVRIVLLPTALGRLGAALDALTPTSLLDRDRARRAVEGVDVIHTFNREYMGVAERLARHVGARHITTPLVHPGQPLGGGGPRDVAIYRRASAVLALTDWEARWYVARGIPADRVHVTGIGPNLGQLTAGTPQAATILFVGRREAYKGYRALARAAPLVWRIRPDARFEIIGQRPWHAGFTDRLLPAVRDTRWVDHGVADEPSKARAYVRCTLLCVPSVHETFGHVFLEAWLARRPVIAGDVPPVREVVEGAGLLVPQRPGAIAAAILALVRDPGLARGLAERGHERVVQRFTWPAVAQRVETAYRAALSS